MAPIIDDALIIPSARRVAIAADSCALLTSDFVNAHGINVAQMRINIGDESFSDDPNIDYADIYRRIADQPETRAWVSAPVPEVWLETIKNASKNAESVICITVAAGLSASYDSARIAATMAQTENPQIDVHVVDSSTISGALKLLVMDATRATDAGLDADAVVNHIQQTKQSLHTIAVVDRLDRIHHIANTPKTAVRFARALHIKPVVTFDTDEFRLMAKPFSIRGATRRMIQEIAKSLGDAPARFVVLHVDALNRAKAVAEQIRAECDCQLMDISDFHPFIGLYSSGGAIGIAWQQLPPEQL